MAAMRVVLFVLLMGVLMLDAAAESPRKTGSALYPPEVVARVRENVANDPWAAKVRDEMVEAAAFWHDMPDEALWDLMFGPELERSWMVWSNGYSPVTGEPVPMYNWKADAQGHPWKLQDPTSGEWFPKNDFKAYYDSGLNAAGRFDPALADASLLFNTEHPDPADPKHLFGVDDGTGYVNEKGERWRFIATYLIYGQWKQGVLGGIRALSAAHVLTGNPVHARKAAILLDRVADFYPEFDFGAQAILYEGPGAAGYVSTWHDACEETREMVMCYDMIFDAIQGDDTLVAFLAKQAETAGLENPKRSFADIQRNIEGGILRDALAHPDKIHSNYPRAEILKAVTVAVLQEPEEEFWRLVEPMIEKTTAVDGVTGEKGLAGYASFTLSALACFLSEFSKADPAFVEDMLARFPRLKDTFRFHIDTICLQRYYPLIGDTGHFAARVDRYVGADFLEPGGDPFSWGKWTLLAPSNYRLFWKLYEATGDASFVQILYRENGHSTDGLPYDLYASDGAAFREQVNAVIDKVGDQIDPGSVNKEAWCLAILRAGQGEHERALWLDYDTGGGHGHQDGLNLGLFAHGLDFMPDFGYPPVQFGGWGSPRAMWYTETAAHNTVVIDGKNQGNGQGKTLLWHEEDGVHAIVAEGAAFAGVERYERTAVMVDIDETNFYVVDVFRVRGGKEHTKFMQSHWGKLTTDGLDPKPVEMFPGNEQMRNFQLDADAPNAWQAHWAIEDQYEMLDHKDPLGLHYWDFTRDAAAGISEAWIVANSFDGNNERWIPRLVMQREAQDDAPLTSTFVAVFTPWRNARAVKAVHRLDAEADSEVILEILLEDGNGEVVILRDLERMPAHPMVSVPGQAIETDKPIARFR
jgi:hypothetical protein